jgi:hypothetical protein
MRFQETHHDRVEARSVSSEPPAPSEHTSAMLLPRLSDAPHNATDLDCAPIVRRLKQLYGQLAAVPRHLQRIENAPNKTLAMIRSIVAGARHQLVVLAATSEDLVQRTAADQLGPCESLVELVVRAIRRALLVEIGALRRASGQPEARVLERRLSMRLDEFARPVEIELRSIAERCARSRRTLQIQPADYRATVNAVAQSLGALVARPDVAMFVEEARRRTDWPAVARVCQRLWDVTQLRIDVDAAWLPHQLSERVAMATRRLMHECARKATRAGLAAAMYSAEAAGAVVPTDTAGVPTLVVVPPGMPDPAVGATACVLANPGISTGALRYCLALHPGQLRRTLHQLVEAQLIRVEHRPRPGNNAGGARRKLCFPTVPSTDKTQKPGANDEEPRR